MGNPFSINVTPNDEQQNNETSPLLAGWSTGELYNSTGDQSPNFIPHNQQVGPTPPTLRPPETPKNNNPFNVLSSQRRSSYSHQQIQPPPAHSQARRHSLRPNNQIHYKKTTIKELAGVLESLLESPIYHLQDNGITTGCAIDLEPLYLPLKLRCSEGGCAARFSVSTLKELVDLPNILKCPVCRRTIKRQFSICEDTINTIILELRKGGHWTAAHLYQQKVAIARQEFKKENLYRIWNSPGWYKLNLFSGRYKLDLSPYQAYLEGALKLTATTTVVISIYGVIYIFHTTHAIH